MRVLLVVHGFPPRAQGGSELYAEGHARGLVEGFGDTVLVLTRDDDQARPEFEVREDARDGYRVVRINHTFRESTSLEDAWSAPRVAAVVRPIIDAFAPDIAHVHHLTCLSTRIPSMLSARHVPVVLTLHDYWLMCHRGQLLDLDGARCDGPGDAGCARCLPPAAAAATGPLGSAGIRAVRALKRHAPALGETVRGAAGAVGRLAGGDESARAVSLARTRLGHATAETALGPLAGCIAEAQHDIRGAGVHRGEHECQVARGVLPVAVEPHDEVVALAQGEAKPRPDGAADAEPLAEADGRRAVGLGHASRAVGRSVVNDEHGQPRALGGEVRDDAGQAGGLVVGWHDREHTPGGPGRRGRGARRLPPDCERLMPSASKDRRSSGPRVH